MKDTDLLIDGLKARIAKNEQANTEMRERIKELSGKATGRVISGRWGRGKAKAKAKRPKKRKMSPEARQRIVDGLRAYRERMARAKAQRADEQNQAAESTNAVMEHEPELVTAGGTQGFPEGK